MLLTFQYINANRNRESANSLRILTTQKEASDRRVEALERKTQPRAVTSSQRSRLIASLSDGPKGPVIVLSDWMDMEAKTYAATLESILRDAGFSIVSIWPEVLAMNLPGKSDERPTVILFVEDVQHPPAAAKLIEYGVQQNQISTGMLSAQGDITRGRLKDDAQTPWTLDGNTTVMWVMNRM